jgi:hypothetical protein
MLASQMNEKYNITFCIALICSAFLFGINLQDDLRGSKPSAISFTKKISGQLISFDVLQGPVVADNCKRKNKMLFTSGVLTSASALNKNTVIIAGWWYNEIIMQLPPENNLKVAWLFYADENQLKDYTSKGFDIYFLPEQNTWNDARYGKKFTERYASRWH